MAKVSFGEQLSNLFKRLTFVQKIVIAGAVVAVVAGLIFLTNSSFPKHEYAVLFSNLESSDAAMITKKLKEKQIEYQLEDNGTTILVDKKVLYESRLQLASEGLPENSTVGYEIFDKTNLGMSEFVQKLNYRRALEGELSRTIASIDEVKKVRVHIVMPDKALFEKDQRQPTASVSLQMKSTRGINKVNIEGIQNLVASSIEGLSPNNVTIVDHKGKILSEQKIDEKSVAGITSQQHEQQKKVDQYLSSKVKSMLDGVLGAENAEVIVNTQLDFTQIEKTITDFNPEKQVIRSEQNSSDNTQASDTSSSPAVRQARNQSNSSLNYEIPKTVEKIIQEVGNVKRITASVLVNNVKKVTEKNGVKQVQYVPRSDEEMQKLNQIVKNSIGYDPSRNDQVTVLNVSFESSFQEEEIDPSTQQKWFQNPEYIKLALLVIAMLAIIFLMYRILQSRQVKERLRIALSLPGGSYDGDKGTHERQQLSSGMEGLEEFNLEDDQILMLPTELPEPLLLESDKSRKVIDSSVEADMMMAPRMAAAGKDRGEMTDYGDSEFAEDLILKTEIKNKVQEYLDNQTVDGVKIIRFYMSQDSEEQRSSRN